ncbi:MAG: hypothetical protein CFE26_05405 [Verrucomicrobiales bacterium VVV1]|nr:MAG: hypothetical protein CFE26_05405 [Verrucomicrobiales bacterium VVV1]
MKPSSAWALSGLCLLITLPLAVAQGVKAPKDDPAFIKKAALAIDQHVATWYRRQKLEVPSVTDDATFMRRSFLVAIGRIPTAEEARAFLEISDAGKRLQLVDYLLESPGYSSNLTNWTFDLLRLADGKIGTTANNEPYRNWVRNAVAENMPWDRFVHTMISADVGYYTRDRGMPLDNLANSMRIFLGSRMECAQCHDDPFDGAERHEFYELAAFTHGQGTVRQNLMRPLWDEMTKTDGQRSPEYGMAQVIWDRVYGMSLSGGGAGRIELPQDYQYRDGKPGEVVGAKTPFGKGVRMSEKKDEQDGRAQLADWFVSKTGTQFAGNIANRLWKRVMGKAVFEPADIYVPAAKTNYPELMAYLEQLMIELQYDQKAFQKVLLSTRTYQFATNPDASVVEGGDDFHGRKISRIGAEQIWDSLITLASGDPDKKPRRTLDDRIYVGGRPVLVGKKTMPQLSQEVLALKSEGEVRAYFSKFVSDIKSGGGGSNSSSDSMMMSSVKTYNKDAQVRASELPSPAPRDHLLYLFGQSDREVVDASSREPNVGQVLSLMNGFVQRQLVNNPNAHLYKSLEGASTDQEKIRRLYVAILSRPPSEEEMGWMLEEVKASKANGYRNIVSSLVMSSEFLFLQ